MSTWNPFTRPASSAATAGLEGVALLEAQMRTQRAVILHILACMVNGQPIHPEEEPLRVFLGLPEGVTADAARDALLRTQARVIGSLTCPKCGATLHDMEGIKNERCQWCGAELTSEK